MSSQKLLHQGTSHYALLEMTLVLKDCPAGFPLPPSMEVRSLSSPGSRAGPPAFCLQGGRATGAASPATGAVCPTTGATSPTTR